MELAALETLFSLKGKTALVTGGSVSIGKAIALALAQSGADVAIQSARAADAAFDLPDAAASTCREIVAMGRRGMAIDADFSVPGEARRSFVEAEAALERIDILVIAASIQRRQPFGDVAQEELLRQAQVNFFSTVELLQAAVAPMAARGWGRVLSIGSINQDRPDPELSVYAALKAAQFNLICNLARQYAPSGVTLNTLSPGLVATERNRWRREDADEWAAIQNDANPMGRAGRPEDMLGAALLLCSAASSFITGANVEATGGSQL